MPRRAGAAMRATASHDPPADPEGRRHPSRSSRVSSSASRGGRRCRTCCPGGVRRRTAPGADRTVGPPPVRARRGRDVTDLVTPTMSLYPGVACDEMGSRTTGIADAFPPRELARAVRDACVDAALEAYETAGLGGLCAEGRWEAAV